MKQHARAAAQCNNRAKADWTSGRFWNAVQQDLLVFANHPQLVGDVFRMAKWCAQDLDLSPLKPHHLHLSTHEAAAPRQVVLSPRNHKLQVVHPLGSTSLVSQRAPGSEHAPTEQSPTEPTNHVSVIQECQRGVLQVVTACSMPPEQGADRERTTALLPPTVAKPPEVLHVIPMRTIKASSHHPVLHLLLVLWCWLLDLKP